MDENDNPIHSMLSNILDPKEEYLSNRDINVFDPLLLVDNLYQFKNEVLKESWVDHDNLNLCELNIVSFGLPQVINFPEFIGWHTQQYSESQR